MEHIKSFLVAPYLAEPASSKLFQECVLLDIAIRLCLR